MINTCLALRSESYSSCAAANAGGAALAASGSGRGAGAPGQAKQSGNNHVAGGGDATKNAQAKMLNGNAAAFVPSLPPPNSLAPSSSLPNGTISYRNAAGAPHSFYLDLVINSALHISQREQSSSLCDHGG